MFGELLAILSPFGVSSGNPGSTNANRVDTMPTNTNAINTTTMTNVAQSVVDENLPQLLDSRGGYHVINVLAFDKENFISWNVRFLVFLDRLEPYLLKTLEDGPFVHMSSLSTSKNPLPKCQNQWSNVETRLANEDKRLKSITHEGPSNTRDTKIANLRLKFNAFKSFECEKVTDKESVSSEDEGTTKIREFMAIVEDEPFVGKADARRKENNPTKEVLFTNYDVSTSEFAPMITSDSEESSEKGKHHKASFKTNRSFSINKSLRLQHMDPFRPVKPQTISHNKYTLIIVDDIQEPKKLIKALEEEGWIIVMQEELNHFKKRLEAIRIFLAYASYMGFIVYQMDMKSSFLNGKISKKVYVEQPLRLLNQNDEVVLIAPRKRDVYVIDMSSFNEESNTCFLAKASPRKLIGALEEEGWIIVMHEELNQFKKQGLDPGSSALWYQANPKETYLVVVKRIFRYLKGTQNSGLCDLKGSCFDLKAYSDSDYAGCNHDRKAEAEYVAAAVCCAQVLWIKSQLANYDVLYDKDKPLSFTQDEFISAIGLPICKDTVPILPNETIRAGLATLGLFDKEKPNLSSIVLVNSSPLKMKYFLPIYLVHKLLNRKKNKELNICYTRFLSLAFEKLLGKDYVSNDPTLVKP
uniref:Reverse transcriptase Ty1/copia-type domain-containing protein n=1 Tax=Tanacetum cinerariifolium TaxID=118510 RepID=A0A6L2JJ29_TANCI|nr:hypothetical protein [Tanacetum cinerariifolium]